MQISHVLFSTQRSIKVMSYANRNTKKNMSDIYINIFTGGNPKQPGKDSLYECPKTLADMIRLGVYDLSKDSSLNTADLQHICQKADIPICSSSTKVPDESLLQIVK